MQTHTHILTLVARTHTLVVHTHARTLLVDELSFQSRNPHECLDAYSMHVATPINAYTLAARM